MATRRFQINIGENAYNITETVGLATVNKNIELTVDFDAAVPGNATTGKVSREDVVQALNELMDYILRSNWPPA